MHTGQFGGRELGQLQFVPGVDDRPQQRDRDRLHVAFAQHGEGASGVVVIELLEHGAVCVDSLVDTHDVASRQQQRRLLPLRGLGAQPFFDADDLVAAGDGHGRLEARSGDEPDPRTGAGEQRVDAHRGGVRQEIRAAQRFVEGEAHGASRVLDRVADAHAQVVMGRQRLADTDAPVGVDDDAVGERAPGVDPDAIHAPPFVRA